MFINTSLNNKQYIYVWPNPHIPFMPYLIHNKIRIFMISNLQHNYEWFNECKNNFRESDYFFVRIGFGVTESSLRSDDAVFKKLNLNKDNFFVLFNDHRDEYLHEKYGFNGAIVNHNAWLDETKYTILDEKKIYDALLVGRADPCKRLYLANKVKNLVLITGQVKYEDQTVLIPPHINNDTERLGGTELIKLMNQSRCGLCLSNQEGACSVSSEFLLCGVPVISTMNEGGRNVWYDNQNCIMVHSNEDHVADAVSEMLTKKVNSLDIRNNHIELSKVFRKRFIDIVTSMLKKHDIKDIDAKTYFNCNFVNKMISCSYETQDIISIFKDDEWTCRNDYGNKSYDRL